MKVAVIGLGGSGSAALRFLSAAGNEAVGYEQFSLGHVMGSSHGHSRLIRRAYLDGFHTRRMEHAYCLWSELEDEAGEELFVRCGGITFGPPSDPTLEATRMALAGEGIDHVMLSRREAAERFPAIDIGDGNVALYQEDSGFLRADRCLSAQINGARVGGARIHENLPVSGIEEKGGRVYVSTPGLTEMFDAVIVTAGPWLGALLGSLLLPLRTALRQTAYLSIGGPPEYFSPDRLPVWIEHPSDHYGFPSDGVIRGIKVASHHAGCDFDPDRSDRPFMEAALERLRNHVMKRFPALGGEVEASQSCLYTITPDERFILDFVPGSRRVVICSGCSGHGFKFTVLLGEIVSQMAVSGRRFSENEPWGLKRFRGN